MGVYRNISTTFWTDAKIDDDFTPEDKYFYLYLLTNPHTNICGCYEISKRQIERETGYCWDTVSRLFERMERIHMVLKYSDVNKEVLLLNWDKYNWSKSEKVKNAVYGVSFGIKTESFRKIVREKIKRKWPDADLGPDPEPDAEISNSTTYTDTDISDTDTYKQKADIESDAVTVTGGYPSDTVSIPYGYHMDTVSEKPEKAKSKRFVKPTLEEVTEYIESRGSQVDPIKWYDYYEANGWKVGKNPMKDWKAAVRTWERNGFNNGSGPKSNNQNKTQEMYDAVDAWARGDTYGQDSFFGVSQEY